MALNPSGPISFGGPTAGQSINLELGVSATALASIDSAPFRTLAAIPTGTIALSNFYGKSSNSYWVLAASRTVLNRGLAASVNGVLCLGPGQDTGSTGANNIYFFSADGVLTKSTIVFSYYDILYGYQPRQIWVGGNVNNNSSSAPIFYVTVQANLYGPYGAGAFNSTTNTNLFSNKWCWGTNVGYDYDYPVKGVMFDASNNVYTAAHRPTRYFGKFTAYQTACYSFSSTGAARWGLRNTGTYAPAAFQAQMAAVRTDTTLAVIGCGRSSGPAELYRVNTSTGEYVQSYRYEHTEPRGVYGNFFADSSNNLYWCTYKNGGFQTPVISKIASSYTTATARMYYPSPDGAAQAGWFPSFSFYNGKIYMFATTGSSTRMTVVQIDASTMLPEWTLNMTFSVVPTSEFGDSGQSTIFATSVGIYVAIRVNGYNNYFKLPLDGEISGTKSVSPPSGSTGYSVTFSKVTSGSTMCASSPTDFTYISGGSGIFTNQTANGDFGQNPENGGTPATTKSAF